MAEYGFTALKPSKTTTISEHRRASEQIYIDEAEYEHEHVSYDNGIYSGK